MTSSKRNSIKNKRFIFIVLGVIVFILIVISSPFFVIAEIEILGNNTLTEEKVLELADLEKGNNIFYFNRFKASRNLLGNPYVADVDISTQWPYKITIDIKERVVRSYVLFETTNSYLLIDEYGRVLDVLTYMPERLPVIIGLKVTGFATGALLSAENPEKFEHVIILSQLLTKYEIDDVVKVDVTSPKEINLYIGGITVKFGGIEDADEKVRNIREIILNFDSSLKGTLDISDIKRDPLFKYLT